MYFEKLALEIHATKAGWEVVKPARCRGTSGVDHKFSFLASKGAKMCAFDFYSDVGTVEVIRTYIKALDASVEASVVCLGGKASDEATALAKEYGLKMLSPAGIEKSFLELPIEVLENDISDSVQYV